MHYYIISKHQFPASPLYWTGQCWVDDKHGAKKYASLQLALNETVAMKDSWLFVSSFNPAGNLLAVYNADNK